MLIGNSTKLVYSKQEGVFEMKKVVIIFMLCGLLFARTRAEKWQIVDVNVSGNKVITASYLNSGIKIHNGVSTLNVYGRSTVNYWTLAPNEKEDFYPLNLFGGSPLTLNATTTTSVQYIWFDNKE